MRARKDHTEGGTAGTENRNRSNSSIPQPQSIRTGATLHLARRRVHEGMAIEVSTTLCLFAVQVVGCNSSMDATSLLTAGNFLLTHELLCLPLFLEALVAYNGVGNRLLSSADVGKELWICLYGCQTPAQHWIKILHPCVQRFYPVLRLGSGGRLLRHFQPPTLHWIHFSLRWGLFCLQSV